jgi:hypothetical protein
MRRLGGSSMNRSLTITPPRQPGHADFLQTSCNGIASSFKTSGRAGHYDPFIPRPVMARAATGSSVVIRPGGHRSTEIEWKFNTTFTAIRP